MKKPDARMSRRDVARIQKINARFKETLLKIKGNIHGFSEAMLTVVQEWNNQAVIYEAGFKAGREYERKTRKARKK